MKENSGSFSLVVLYLEKLRSSKEYQYSKFCVVGGMSQRSVFFSFLSWCLFTLAVLGLCGCAGCAVCGVSHFGGFSGCGRGSRSLGLQQLLCSWTLEHRFNSCRGGLSCSVACGILLDQILNPRLLHRQAKIS